MTAVGVRPGRDLSAQHGAGSSGAAQPRTRQHGMGETLNPVSPAGPPPLDSTAVLLRRIAYLERELPRLRTNADYWRRQRDLWRARALRPRAPKAAA